MGKVNIFDEVTVVKNKLGKDERGFSTKFFDKKINFDVTENLVIKSKKGVLRGIHYQTMYAQNRMITCLQGKIWLVVVDLRKTSSMRGEWCAIELSGEDAEMTSVIIPKEFGIGTYAIEDSIIDYKCDGKYVAGYDSGIIWNDLTLAIDWPVNSSKDVIISQKDKEWQMFNDYRKTV